jgi:hypothetical protein
MSKTVKVSDCVSPKMENYLLNEEESLRDETSVHTKYYVQFPKKITKCGYPLSTEAKHVMKRYFMKNYSDIFKKCKHGDFIEDGTKSGYRTNGLYMIEKISGEDMRIIELGEYPDAYGSIPEQFLGLRDFVPGYHDDNDLIMDPKCRSTWHNNFFPIHIPFLRRQPIHSFEFTPYLFFSSFYFKGKKILTIYPFSYSFRPDKEIEYFYIINNTDDEIMGLKDYTDNVMKGVDCEMIYEDDQKNGTYKLIQQFSRHFDVVMAPINLKDTDFPQITYHDSSEVDEGEDENDENEDVEEDDDI